MRNRTVTIEVFDEIKKLHQMNPEMRWEHIAAILVGNGLTQRKLSKTTIQNIRLRCDTYDDYVICANPKKNKTKCEHADVSADDHIVEPESCEPLSEEAESDVTDTKECETEEKSIPETRNEIADLIETQTMKIVEEIRNGNRSTTDSLVGLLVAKGTNGFKDETIANKVSNVAAGCGGIKKDMNNCFNVVFENQQYQYNAIAEVKTVMCALSKSMVENNELLTKQNKLIEKLVEIWETDDNYAEM